MGNGGGVYTLDLAYTTGVAATGVSGAAYVNNDLVASTGTTLFDLDAGLDQIALQSPPNAGSLFATGKLGVDVAGDSGFDVFSATVGGVTASNHAFASLARGTAVKAAATQGPRQGGSRETVSWP